MNSLLENIDIIHKRKNHIDNLIKIIISNQIKFSVYKMSNNDDFSKMKSYESIIDKMMTNCFGSSGFKVMQYQNVLWIVGKLDGIPVAALMIHLKGAHNSPWIWSVCRDKNLSMFEIGKKLIKYTLHYLHKTYPQYNKVYLYAAQKPKSRTQFYKALGFNETGIKSDDDPEMMYELSHLDE